MTEEIKTQPRTRAAATRSRLWHRVYQATGTVYGDIGTSVLYTVMEITREAIQLKHHARGSLEVEQMVARGGSDLLSRSDLLGQLSLIYWALVFLTLKYDLMIMRADHRGEGGTFALWSLLRGYTGKLFAGSAIGVLVVCAAALLAADGIITPPISMLGAFEPLGPSLSVLITLVCLGVLFGVQWKGTAQVGSVFGWFMVGIWFPWIAIKGLPWIIAQPEVFLALNPMYAIHFLFGFPVLGALVILGVVVLAITGGEAKFADIGHFSLSVQAKTREGESISSELSGRIPVMVSWFTIVLPGLLLCYSGQVAYMLKNGVPARANTFYAITPQLGWESIDRILALSDMAIAAIAAIIASQALITGMFSIVKQATSLGFSPRFRVVHTDSHGEGQVYIPAVNWALFFGCVGVTIAFQTAGNLAAAYGVAVTGTMGITTLIFAYVAYYHWKWPLLWVLAMCVPILAIDSLFFVSNLLKIASGGYVPLLIAAILVVIMQVWQWGRSMLGKAFYNFGVVEGKRIEWLVALREMLDDIQMAIEQNLPAARVLIQGRRRLVESDRAAVFLCSRPIETVEDYVPINLRIFLKKYGVLPSQLVLFHVDVQSVPTIPHEERYRVVRLGNDIHSVTACFGFMEQPNIRRSLRDLQSLNLLRIAGERWIVEVGEEEIILSDNLTIWQRIWAFAFSVILRLSTPAHKYLGLTYDAAISKEIVPVVFERHDVRVALPELELQHSTSIVTEASEATGKQQAAV
ncbi:MAG: KUP/HAK/KT family potassium transporter [Planctomycetes bacterium]|nr:KUP/HAK/KT family potassium transporter [Planctomycetota bacterium]